MIADLVLYRRLDQLEENAQTLCMLEMLGRLLERLLETLPHRRHRLSHHPMMELQRTR